LKVLLVNLLAALNFANVYKNKKNVKKRKKRDQKTFKNVFTSMVLSMSQEKIAGVLLCMYLSVTKYICASALLQ